GRAGRERRRGVGAAPVRRLARPPASRGRAGAADPRPARAAGTEGRAAPDRDDLGRALAAGGRPRREPAGAGAVPRLAGRPPRLRPPQAPAGGGRGDHRPALRRGVRAGAVALRARRVRRAGREGGRCRPRLTGRRRAAAGRAGRTWGLSPGDKSRPEIVRTGDCRREGCGFIVGPGNRSPSQRSQVMGRPAHPLVRLVRVPSRRSGALPLVTVSVLAASALAAGAAAVPVSARETGRTETPVASGSPVTEVRESVVRVKIP